MRKDRKCTTRTNLVIGLQVVLVDRPGRTPVAMDSNILCPGVI